MNSDLSAYASGSTEPWAVSVLQALVRLRKPRQMLELGTFEARTTSALVDASPWKLGDVLTTVDIERRWETLPERTTFVEMDAIEFLEQTPKGDFDFAFVDDDHTFEHVRAEVSLLTSGIVRSGGLIVLHDVIGPFGLHAVVEEFGGFIVDLPLLHAAGGLGVIEI